MGDGSTFCNKCGKQLLSIYERAEELCSECQEHQRSMKSSSFFCWACGTQIYAMNEIAQGVCDNCKAAILRKNQQELSIDLVLKKMLESLENKI